MLVFYWRRPAEKKHFPPIHYLQIEKDNFIPIFCNTPATQLAEFDAGPAMQYSHSSTSRDGSHVMGVLVGMDIFDGVLLAMETI